MTKLRRAIRDHACGEHHLRAHQTLFFSECLVLRCRIAKAVGK